MAQKKPLMETNRKGEVLIALLRKRADLAILQEQLWYRIPVIHAPKRWPPEWVAFYQPKDFEDEAFSIQRYGRVREIRRVKRRDLFPNEIPSVKSEQEYYQVCLHGVESLAQPIWSNRARRVLFIPTTWAKFSAAAEFNDLFDDSPLEDRLWTRFKQLNIASERQWGLDVGQRTYALDFAIFCRGGNIDVETDGDTYHANARRAPMDNERNNALTAAGWQVLRFNTRQINERMETDCIRTVTKTMKKLGGPSEAGLVPRAFYSTPSGVIQQLTLFEAGPEYEAD